MSYWTFEEVGVVLEVMDIVPCYRLGKMNRVFVKLLNQKDAQYILEDKYKLRNIVIWSRWEHAVLATELVKS